MNIYPMEIAEPILELCWLSAGSKVVFGSPSNKKN